ncbi:MAG: hypothetical protein ACQESZ_09165 [Bacteroidota bacterium]
MHNRKAIIKIILILFFWMGILPAKNNPLHAQIVNSRQFASGWTVNANLGMTSFYGDLTDQQNRVFTNTPFSKFFYEDRALAYALLIKKDLSADWTFRASLMHGKVKSHSATFQRYFENRLTEYYLGLEYNFSNLIWGYENSREWRLYGFVGIGLTDFRTKVYDLQTDQELRSVGYYGTRWFDDQPPMKTETTIPFGLGFDYQLNSDWTLTFETGIHGINTDLLDGFEHDHSGVEGFGYTSMGLSYNFNMLFGSGKGGIGSYRGQSTDPAIKQYNKKRRVVMKTKMQRKAARKRFIPPNQRNFFQRIWYRLFR